MRNTAIKSVGLLADVDPRVVFIGSDLGPGILDEMKQKHRDRFFMEGVAEQHVIGMAAGLAAEGFRPYINTIATFLTRRCYEQVAVDLCLQNLPVTLIASGGGAVYAPLGPTHLAVEDISLMRHLPNMTVIAPCDADEMARLMPRTLDVPGPIYIRLAKGGDPIVSRSDLGFEIGKGIKMTDGDDALIISTGVATQIALKAQESLQESGLSCSVLHVHTIKPLDSETIFELAKRTKRIVVVEEHFVDGGLGSAVMEALSTQNLLDGKSFSRIGIPDKFADKYGSQNDLLNYWGVTSGGVCEAIMNKKKV